jgi:hypothetical protein
MRRLRLNTENVQFSVTRNAEVKTDQTGKQKFDKDSGLPMWSLEVMAQEEKGGSILNVTVVNEVKPTATVGQIVALIDLEALPWANSREGNLRSGVAFRASDAKVLVPAGK